MANPYDPTDPPMDTEACDDVLMFRFTYPPKVSSSGGIWGENKFQWYMLPMVQMRFIVVFFSTHFLHFLLRPFGFHKITSEILAGFMMNVRVMNGEFLTSHFIDETLSVICKFNYLFFLFIMGVKVDTSAAKHIEKKVWGFGCLIVMLPLLLSVATATFLSSSFEFSGIERMSLMHVSAMHSSTFFSVIVTLVSELRMLNSELGKFALSVATVSDFMSMLLILMGSTIKIAISFDFVDILKRIAIVTCYILVLAFAFRPWMTSMNERIPRGSTINGNYLFMILAMGFGSAGLFSMLNMNLFLPPYLLGLAMPSGPPVGSTLEAKYSCFIMNISLPFFVSFCAAKANFFSIALDDNFWISIVIVLMVVVSAKLIVSWLLALSCGLPKCDALVLALILSSKGVMDIANFSFAWELQIIPNRFFSIALFAIFVTSAIVPILVKNLYNPSRKYLGYVKRALVDSRPETGLPILACIYVPENISPVIKLIDSCIVNKGMPIVVHALHLLTLTGQITPVFIAHGLDRKLISDYASSKEVILAFKQLARNYQQGCITLQAFTAISPPELMSEDILRLALSKTVSLIILPFHRTWTVEGHHTDDNNTRALNSSILEKAPCSVGILVDRGHHASTRSPSHYLNVAMIFFGGKDDREGLVLAKRMGEKHNNAVTIVHVNYKDGKSYNRNWDCILDSEALKDIKCGNCSQNIMYQDVWIDDGSEMVEAIRGLISSYKLIIVGRGCDERTPHAVGLEIWSEFPELGFVGDLLITGDFDGEYSFLVVKQQDHEEFN